MHAQAWPSADRRSIKGILLRPFDFYVGFLVALMGLYGIIDPSWPPNTSPLTYWLVSIEDVYLVVAGSVVMGCLIAKQLNYKPLLAYQMEMLAWLFICAAALVIVMTIPWVPPIDMPSDGWLLWVWGLLWLGLAGASFLRFWATRKALLAGHLR